MLSTVIESAMNRVPGLDASDVEDVCVGNVLGGPAASVTARYAVCKSLSHEVPVRMVNRQCASGLQAVADVASMINAGQIKVGLGIGYECMSTNTMEDR